MWRRLVGRAHLDAGGDDSLILWAIATRGAICSGDLGSEFPRREHGDGPLRRCNGSTSGTADRVPFDQFADLGDRKGRYASRSEADFGACLGMVAAGLEEAEVWATMTDPTHGISEKFLEKGRGGERYLSLTIGKAAAKATASRLRVGRSKAPRVRRRVA
jgi:hypothetical protein